MDVIFKEGMVYLQGVKFGKRTWRKMRMVLFKPSSTGVGRLELYTVLDNNAVTDQKKVGWQKTPERKVKDPGESDKGGFESGNGLTMEENDLYSSWKTELTLPPNQYQVTIQSTEASRRCQLAGEYLVSPEKEAVILLAINTGHTIYRWPYRLLRKFGQVEGGFSIEAGRRCESGEGVFIFLSRHGPQVFQAILTQCSVERESSIQPFSVHRRSLSDQSPVILPITSNWPSGSVYNPAAVSADPDDGSANHYSTINDTSVLVKPYLSNSKEAVGDEGKDEDERCHSLENISLNNAMEDNIYYNLRRATPPMIRKDQFNPETDDSESIYSDVKIVYSPLNPQLQPFSSPLPQPVPQPPPLTLPQSVSCVPPKARYQHQPPANNYIQPVYNAQAQAVDDMKEMEEATSSHVGPTEAPGSFKHRLAEIISKDLAKFQPPSGAGSPTFSQY